jgi:hypothetical protein
MLVEEIDLEKSLQEITDRKECLFEVRDTMFVRCSKI